MLRPRATPQCHGSTPPPPAVAVAVATGPITVNRISARFATDGYATPPHGLIVTATCQNDGAVVSGIAATAVT